MRLDSFWWQLPGPAAFVDALLEDLTAGRNVVLALPEHAPPGLDRVVPDRVRQRDLFHLRILDVDEDADLPPSQLVHQRLAPLEAWAVPTPETVVQARELRESVIWVAGLTERTWPAWRRFLETYQGVCRCRDASTCPLFVAPVAGPPAAHVPATDVTLAIRRWQGVVRRVDMLLYAWRLFETSPFRPLHQELAVAITTELAGTDPVLAEHLAQQPLERVLAPWEALRELAKARGWPIASNSGSPFPAAQAGWLRGLTDWRDGRPLMHAAAEAAKHDGTHVQRRIWRAQIGVLFPFLADQRLQFVRRFRHLLHVPITTPFETIAEVESLELTHLCHQLRPQVLAHRLGSLECCLRIRNDLAHLRPAASEDLTCPEFLQLLETP